MSTDKIPSNSSPPRIAVNTAKTMALPKQASLFDNESADHASVAETAIQLGVSTATIHNWLKTGYLEKTGKGSVCKQSIKQFESNFSGRVKLTNRANKSLKDTHNHDEIASDILQKLSLPLSSVEDLSSEYESALSDSYRNKEGVYYTPSAVVDDLLDLQNIETKDATFCDPCCGTGNFIIRAINLGFQPEKIYGFDTDPVAVAIAKERVFRETGYHTKNIKVANFLESSISKPGKSYDFIYTNPPWGKKISKDKKKILTNALGAGSSADTSALFFFASLKQLKTNGKIGLLLPESFFNISIFEHARVTALENSILRLVDYGKAFKNLMSKAQGIVLQKTPARTNQLVQCLTQQEQFHRSQKSFSNNPKSILNFHCCPQNAQVLSHLFETPSISLKNNAAWGLGIVTGNNKRFLKTTPQNGHIPVYRGSDISNKSLKPASHFIPEDLNLYQQVAPVGMYYAKEKLIYRFISNRLCFYHDTEGRLVLNSANILIPKDNFPVSTRILGQLLNSDFMNWFFSEVFNTTKILRGDLEVLPIYDQYLQGVTEFNETVYLKRLKIHRLENGTYGITR